MKHLKYIKEYFDSDEIKHRMSGDELDMKKLVSDDSILVSSERDVIVSNIKYEIPYFKKWDAIEYENGILLKEGFDYYIGSGESVLAMFSLHIDVTDVPEDFKIDNRLEDKFYQVSYASVIFWIDGEEKTKIFEDEYKGLSSSGNGKIVPFKTCKGMKELIEFLKNELVPQIDKTRIEYQQRTLDKKDDRENRPPTRYN